MTVHCFTPEAWPARVRIATTTRDGGVSRDAFAGLNLGDHVGDDPDAVRANRQRLAGALPGKVIVTWLAQEHGTRVVPARATAARVPVADACWTRQPGLACAVLTADCLPVLLCSADGRSVAAAHAGWRGLVAGVIEGTVSALDGDPQDLHVWLGPAIGPAAFEVGAEIRAAFLHAARAAGRDQQLEEACFQPASRPGHYLADIVGLARVRLGALGVTRIQADGRCTVSEPGLFYSFRRDGQTGRMASLVYIDPT
ncbi:MAG: peptidoglycan editing factor PgeF [Halieaceae bacterium]|jgi:YfiH family protein|nr:peptidoglycan editing factor PgeF [Halieaceae bacterium]